MEQRADGGVGDAAGIEVIGDYRRTEHKPLAVDLDTESLNINALVTLP